LRTKAGKRAHKSKSDGGHQMLTSGYLQQSQKTRYSPQKTTVALQKPDRRSLTEASNKAKKNLLERKLIVQIK